MLSVDQARIRIASCVNPLPMRLQTLETSLGLTLADDVHSPVDLPAFDQSSMDGYAIRHSDILETLRIQGEMEAGALHQQTLKSQQAFRIFTGAPVPVNADTVVMQEKVTAEADFIKVQDNSIEKGTHVRVKGAELQKGELVFEKGRRMTAPIIGLLASMGITHIPVYPRPAVSIITTGKELRKPGETLNFGQVYESNAYFLSAALEQIGIQQANLFEVDDDLALIKDHINHALPTSEIIILTGGVSVGDYDFVRKALDESGVLCQFHRVKQKPGKPFYFGTLNDKLVFGLPGNPGSVITCFYEYVLPAIRQMLQYPAPEPQTAVLKQPYEKVMGLTQFLKGYVAGGIVEILDAQESFRLRSFARANCLVSLDEQRNHYQQGERVRINTLP